MWLGCSADWKLIIKKLHYLSKLSLTMSTREEGIEIEKEYKKSLIACKKGTCMIIPRKIFRMHRESKWVGQWIEV